MIGADNPRKAEERVVITPGAVSFYDSRTGILIISDGTERHPDGREISQRGVIAYTKAIPLKDGEFLTHCYSP